MSRTRSLVSYFVLAFPSVESLQLGWAAVWVYALTLLPAVLTVPWVYKRLGEWLGHAWLGRRYQPVEAVQFFLAGLREATTKGNSSQRAQQRLGDVFEAPVRVETGPASDDDFESESGNAGRIRRGSRRNDIPYFERDKALLGSIAEVFSSDVGQRSLQDARQEQDRRARELSLQASRSELKAAGQTSVRHGPFLLLLRRGCPEGVRAGIGPTWTDRSPQSRPPGGGIRSDGLPGLVGTSTRRPRSLPDGLHAGPPRCFLYRCRSVCHPRLRDAFDTPRDGVRAEPSGRRSYLKRLVYPPWIGGKRVCGGRVSPNFSRSFGHPHFSPRPGPAVGEFGLRPQIQRFHGSPGDLPVRNAG